MKLKRLAINRLPGISQPFEIEAAGAGFHVVYGPNGIGKSSICRAVEGLYWEDRGASALASVNGEFEWDGESWWGQRDGKRLTWQRGGETTVSPNLPPSHNGRCFFLHLRDLIDPSRDGTADIASEIRRQMSGGFDLDRISSDLFTGVTRYHTRRQRNDFNRASDEVQKALAKQAGLQRRADEIGRLTDRLDEAEAATRRLALVERAIGLARRREELAGILEQIEALPGALAGMTGKEVEDVARHQEQADTLAERVRSLEQGLRKAREAQEKTALDNPIEQAELAAWRDNADELRRIELELDAARSERVSTRGALAAALSAIGRDDVGRVALTLSEQGELFDFLRSSHANDARAGAIQERLRLLERVDTPEDSEQVFETSRDAMEALRSWLRVPAPDRFASRLRTRWPWLLLGLAMLLAGAGLAVLADPSPALLGDLGYSIALAVQAQVPPGLMPFAGPLGGLGGGIVLAVLLVGSRRSSKVARQAARAAFEKLSLAGPGGWDLPSVESRLRGLERETAVLESSLQRARDRGVERQALENELEGLSEPRAALDARRQELKDRLALDALPPDAELVDFARALDQVRLARGHAEAAAGKVEGLEQKYAALLAEVAGILERHGEPRPGDAATAGARLNNLVDRNSRLVQAIADHRTMTGQIEEHTADRETTLGSIRRIYADAALGDGDLNGLMSRLNSLQRYRRLMSEQAILEGQIALDCTELEKAGEAVLAECDVQSLERFKDDLSHLEARASQLRNEIAEIRAEMSAARSANVMQDVIAVREDARASLRDLRDEALYAKAGKFLIRAAEEEYEHTRMPRVFERARDHFSSFTYHNYKLELGKGDGTPRLFARESRSGEARELDELSDGTRAQLLLAARIAFAEEAEQGKVLPLFLDEALDQSDPQRFEAIVRSLGCVARDQGRQIFYLTSDPLDVERIRDALGKEDCAIAAEIDLGRIRTSAVSVSGPQALRVDPGPAVPAPDGLSPEEYGAVLGVPAFRPALGWTEQHFFYLLWDHPDLLHEFLSNGIEWAGQWETVSGTPLAERLGSGPVPVAETTSRLELLEVFCELWKQGRGRPVGRDALEASGALTDHYVEDVIAIARELDGDPERLLAALDEGTDPRLRGFRKNSVERLQRYLAEAGYLDDRPVLTEGDLRLRARTTPAADRLPAAVANDCLNRWWGWALNS